MKKILVVDDEEIIRKLARNTIQSDEYRVLEASSGPDALKIATDEKPDLILLDVNIPGKNGYEICRQLKASPETAGSVVILITGETCSYSRAEGKTAGADDYFEKPFSPVELLNKIRVFLEDGREEISIGTDIKERRHAESRAPEDLAHLEREQLLIYAQDLGKLYHEEERKTLELKKAYQRLTEMENMKDAFISLVSHELRTPLSIIKGYVTLINEVMRTRNMSGDLLEFTGAIAEASNKLEKLIHELLDFSKMKSGLITFDKQEISLPGMLQLIVNDHKSEAQGKDIELTFKLETEFRPIRADQARLKTAFSHLLKNAITFTSRGGKIWIEARDEGIWVKVKVCDTGVGIYPEEIENIFSPFYQSKNYLTREVDGIGLGLTIAKHIIEDHGGTISVDSAVGKGTKFIVSLPRSFQDAKEIVAELSAKAALNIDKLTDGLQVAEKQVLLYAQEMSSLYNKQQTRSEQLQENLEELELTYVQTIAALAQAIDTKDSYRGGHTGRVSHYARTIAKKVNPSLLQEKEFIYSLLLHDIGKIGIGEEILGKAGKLSDEEWNKVKAHPEMSANIFGKIKFLTPALASIRSHHERWDGQGYPDGLKEEEIPLVARIIGVADAFDAMTTDRPYRAKMSKEEARDEIIKHSGLQFDPTVVQAFIEAWEEIESYRAGLNGQ